MQRREFLSTAGLVFPGMTAQSALGAQSAPTAERPPDLANLHDTIQWIGDQNPPRMSFLEPRWKSVEEWKKAARPLFLERLSYRPQAKPLGATVVSKEERDGFTVETVRISATEAYSIPARVLIPSGLRGPAPGVVAIHCHSGRYVWGHEKILSKPGDSDVLLKFRETAYGRPYSELLARKGYVVLITDGFYFGERRLRPEDMEPAQAPPVARKNLEELSALKMNSPEWLAAVNRLCSEFEHLTAKTIFTAGATWPGMLVWDDMRSVDYLCSRPEVDAKRIGCLGLSIGGLRTAYLIAADARIKAACVAGWMTEMRRQMRNHLRNHTWMIYVPGLYRDLDLPDAAALTLPGALLVQQCSRDSLYPLEAMKSAGEKLTRIYVKAKMPERFRVSFYDVPHSFRPDMQDEAFAWLDKWL